MRNCINYIWNHFFCLRILFTIFYIKSFQVPPEENHRHLKHQFPAKITIWHKSLLYTCKWHNPPSPKRWGWGWGWVCVNSVFAESSHLHIASDHLIAFISISSYQFSMTSATSFWSSSTLEICFPVQQGLLL